MLTVLEMPTARWSATRGCPRPNEDYQTPKVPQTLNLTPEAGSGLSPLTGNPERE